MADYISRERTMTIVEARAEVPTFRRFVDEACGHCENAYCPDLCYPLEKASHCNHEKLVKLYADCDGYWYHIFKKLKSWKDPRTGRR